ncbi:serine/threonine-protein kinase RIO3 isoform X2 [Oratosquilla oratoria]|uniref:serine/threonine-protein kinase RIO3 isoform X2 n=1 Tax=Oratosquilla oratoria TaxID=337810 RepID=UPI003F77819F
MDNPNASNKTSNASPKKPAWGETQTESMPSVPASSSFKDLMSEDLAKDLQERENKDYYDSLVAGESVPSEMLNNIEDTDSDMMLAQMLQYEFDREYDEQVAREEKHVNGVSKVSVSYSKYKVCPEWYGYEWEEEIDEEERDLDSFEARGKIDPLIPACGYVKCGDTIVTKHDLGISGRKNAERIMNLPPGINTGDGGGFDMELSNKVYNKLQSGARAELRRKQRVHDKEEKATSELAIDRNTRLLLFKLVNNEILESINGIVSSGKEAVVVHAMGGVYEENPLPSEVIVKIFKTTLTNFKTRERYIREDYRFKDRFSKHNTQKTIQLWTEKEYHNLRRLVHVGIPCPTPILIKKHVLVMTFIGTNGCAAPKLKEAALSRSDMQKAYNQMKEAMITMFHKCRLIHADLSEYNILWHDGKCWIIDLAQGVEPTHPCGLQFLFRDCLNVIRFFKSKGVPDLPSPLNLFESITGIVLPGNEDDALTMIEQYETHQELWKEGMKNVSDQFELMWNETQFDNKIDIVEEISDDGDEEMSREGCHVNKVALL